MNSSSTVLCYKQFLWLLTAFRKNTHCFFFHVPLPAPSLLHWPTHWCLNATLEQLGPYLKRVTPPQRNGSLGREHRDIFQWRNNNMTHFPGATTAHSQELSICDNLKHHFSVINTQRCDCLKSRLAGFVSDVASWWQAFSWTYTATDFSTISGVFNTADKLRFNIVSRQFSFTAALI